MDGSSLLKCAIIGDVSFHVPESNLPFVVDYKHFTWKDDTFRYPERATFLGSQLRGPHEFFDKILKAPDSPFSVLESPRTSHNIYTPHGS